MKGLQHYLRQQLSERGLRVTRERQIILDHAFEHFGHFDSEELLESLNRHGIKVSRATVYRTLPQLVEIGPELYAAEINASLCKGCGTCASWCPSAAISARHFTDRQVEAMIDAFFTEEVAS